MAASSLYRDEGDYQVRLREADLGALAALRPALYAEIKAGEEIYARYGFDGAIRRHWDQDDYALLGFKYVYHDRTFWGRAEAVLEALKGFYEMPEAAEAPGGGNALVEQFMRHLPYMPRTFRTRALGWRETIPPRDSSGRRCHSRSSDDPRQVNVLSMGCGSGACAVAVEAWLAAVRDELLATTPAGAPGCGVPKNLHIDVHGMDREPGWRQAFQALPAGRQVDGGGSGQSRHDYHFTHGDSFDDASLRAAKEADIAIFCYVVNDFLPRTRELYFRELIRQWEEQGGPQGSFKLLVKTKELKPPEELVQAIQSSDDATALPSADDSGAAFSGNTPRTVRAHLLHEEQQRLSERHGAHGAVGHVPSKEELKFIIEEQEHLQNKPAEYNRNHPGAGRAGKGDQALGSMHNVCAGRQAPLDHHKLKNAPQ